MRPNDAARTSDRLAALDVARAVALAAMFAYHLAWDLAHFGFIAADIPFSYPMRAAGHVIACAFLFLSGVCLAASQTRWDEQKFWTRFAKILAAAGAVTIASLIFDPAAPITFGILHCIAFGGLLAVALMRLPWPVAALAAIVLFLAPKFYSSALFNGPWLDWTGLQTVPPKSLDFRPLAPWAAALMAGLAAAATPPGKTLLARLKSWRADSAALKILAWGGQRSLLIYLVHQPIFLGVLAGVAAFGDVREDGAKTKYIKPCVEKCQNFTPSPSCAAQCGCVWREMKSFKLQNKLLSGLNQDEVILAEEIQKICARAPL